MFALTILYDRLYNHLDGEDETHYACGYISDTYCWF
jgi:hypothetical protein